MPTFTPPVTDGVPVSRSDDPGDTLWRYYGSWAMGQTVWKDQAGVWHAQTWPYQGGSTTTTHDGDTTTVTAPDEGLATAQEVYLGGHVHEISDAKAVELMDAGFPVGGQLDGEEAFWTDLIINSADNSGWQGADLCQSYDNGSAIVWTFADTGVGTYNPDGFRPDGSFIAVQRNSYVLRDRDTGAHIAQVLPAWTHPDSPSKWWWPKGLTAVGDEYFLVVSEYTSGGFAGVWQRNALLRLNSSFARLDTYNFDNSTGVEWGGVHQDDDFMYVNLTLEGVGHYLGRLRISDMPNESALEYATATSWSSDFADAIRPVDTTGEPVTSTVAGQLTQSGDKWVLAVVDMNDGSIAMYESDLPQGPWRFYHRDPQHKGLPVNVKGDGTVVGTPPATLVHSFPNRYIYYAPAFHPVLFTDTNLVIGYSRGVLGFHDSYDVHASTFGPLFRYLPRP